MRVSGEAVEAARLGFDLVRIGSATRPQCITRRFVGSDEGLNP